VSEPLQVLLLIVGVLFSSLVALLLSQVSGMRTELREYITKQSNLSDRLLKLETEHNSGSMCRFREAS
jgi:hypothetical protein